MNKSCRLLWSDITRTWVAVSEVVKASGKRAGKRAAQGVTLARPKAFSLGERAKKIPTDKGWDFEYWWSSRTPEYNPRYQLLSTAAGVCPCFGVFVHFTE